MGGSPSAAPPLLATKAHAAFCFDTLAGHYAGSQAQAGFEDGHCALFVTWNKASRQGETRLRGCIGTLEPRGLRKALRDNALTSALHDRRFAPIAAAELPFLSCAVSLLHSFERAADWADWAIGTHGLIVNFQEPDTRAARSATFLPEVAAHEGWDQAQTLAALVRKAGYSEDPHRVLPALQVTRYQSSACSMSYAEYFALRTADEAGHLPQPAIAIPVPA